MLINCGTRYCIFLDGYFKLQSVIRCEICLSAALKGKWFDQRT